MTTITAQDEKKRLRDLAERASKLMDLDDDGGDDGGR
jgi:hypothetical protein